MINLQSWCIYWLTTIIGVFFLLKGIFTLPVLLGEGLAISVMGLVLVGYGARKLSRLEKERRRTDLNTRYLG